MKGEVVKKYLPVQQSKEERENFFKINFLEKEQFFGVFFVLS